ncbi:P-type conjugative transfer protein TrbJ [Verminephrobacter aporrectodeae subsp. tuberculatae]|uniref:P-type conjugative transfer protein TrbJ n=1 Tax=Verminephrobacter aporrectodeae TaxID=1110389 RepID=UPI0002D627BA|nr:P-type conjugative transfer protein TrbJ [Verminephrobacter aporrectodeae]MCW8164817.1 P-type conjugative transfer protein TrbJ [Verminephrobacter aporrectodeae subsp. tuberculatae]MCW8169189.1 P-type conjugative transfer protein TrbJ [Verminephrobacter aporrectodeae subsp. tuberculatae]
MSAFSQKPLRNGTFFAIIAMSLMLGSISLLTMPAQATSPITTCVNCSTSVQQSTSYWEQIKEALRQAGKDTEMLLNLGQLIKNTDEQVRIMRQGIKSPLFSSIQGLITNVLNSYNGTNSIGRNDIQQFQQRFIGYEKYLQSRVASSAMPSHYKNWSNQGLDNARTAMQAADTNVRTISNDDVILDQLVQRSFESISPKQVAQVGNEIVAQNVQQLQKLRDLLATQITLQSNYMAQQTERVAVDDAFREKFHSGQVRGTGANKEY